MLEVKFRILTAVLVATLMVLPSAARTVKVSEFGFDPFDSTAFIQRAVDSGAETVVLDRQASDWVSGPVVVTNGNVELVLQDGVTWRAKRGLFKERGDSLVFFYGTKNVAIRGEGRATLVMNKGDYQDRNRYCWSEHRHAIRVLSVTGLRIRNLTILSSGGDAVELAYAKDVLMEDLVCYDHNRQGTSPCDAENLTVRNCVFNNTRGVSPQCGVDLEPWKESQHLKNILFENCVFNGNEQAGIDVHLRALCQSKYPVSIVFRNCTAVGNNQYGIIVYVGSGGNSVKGTLLFENCRVAENGQYAVRFNNQMPDGLKVLFRDCDFDARGASGKCAFLFDNSREQRDFAGVSFEKCRVTLDDDMKLCEFRGMTGAGLRDVAGDFTVVKGGKTRTCTLEPFVARHRPNPELMKEFAANPIDFTKLKAAGTALAAPLATPWLWHRATYLQYVPGKGSYPIVFENHAYPQVGKVRPRVTVRDRWGTDLGTFDLSETETKTTYTIKANGEGLYRFELEMRGANRVKVISPFPGQGYVCDDYQHFYGFGGGCAHDACFTVPAAAKDVRIDIFAEQEVEATVLNGAGETVATFPYKRGRDIFAINRKPTDRDEVWTVRFSRVQENLAYRIGGGAVSVVSMSPEAVLTDR